MTNNVTLEISSEQLAIFNAVLLSIISEPLAELIATAVQNEFQELDRPPQLVSDSHWFNVEALCEYLPDKPAKATVYGWVHNSLIPYHKSPKKLRFLKSDIDAWLKQGRKKTLAETVSEADDCLLNKKRLHNG